MKTITDIAIICPETKILSSDLPVFHIENPTNLQKEKYTTTFHFSAILEGLTNTVAEGIVTCLIGTDWKTLQKFPK